MKRDKNFILFDLGPEQYSLRGLKYLLVLYLSSLIVAAILSGPALLMFLNMQNEVGQYIASKGIDKVFDRIRLIFIILWLPFFCKKCGIISLRDLGCDCQNLHKILSWTLVGICFMCVFEAGEMLLTNRSFEISSVAWSKVYANLPKFLLCAFLVSILEEIIFRGVMLRIFYTAFPVTLAVILSSLFFAYLHIKIPNVIKFENNTVTALTGFRCIFPVLFGFIYAFNVLKFLKITILGIILSKLVLRDFSLNRAIGFHTGVVFAMFILNTLF